MKILLCPLSQPGYLYPAIAVGRELQARGDEVHVLGSRPARRAISLAGLASLPAEEFGPALSFHVSHWFRDGAEQYRAVIRAARSVRPDALVTSLLCLGALLAAESLGLPVIVLGFAAHLWAYRRPGQPGQDDERAWRLAELLRYYALAREQAGLPARNAPPGERALVGCGLLLRGGPDLERAGAQLPERVHHVGPCFWEPPAPADEIAAMAALLRRNGKPVVYVHLGRLFGGSSLWPRLNAAFTDGKFQAIVEQGRSGQPQPAAGADLVVVRKPWMIPLIKQSELVLTSATSAPVLAALRCGRPLVVAPGGSEQPVLARACLRAGAAARLPAGPAGSAAVIAHACDDEALRTRARELGDGLARLPGAAGAAGIVHAAITGGAHA